MEDDDDNESTISLNQNKDKVFWSNGYDRDALANATNASSNKYGGMNYGRNRSNRNNRKYDDITIHYHIHSHSQFLIILVTNAT